MKNMIDYCSNFITFTQEEKELLLSRFEVQKLKRKDYLLKEGKVCNFVAFISKGVVRHFHLKDGNEITCDVSLPNSFVTDFHSLTHNIPSSYNFQILKDSELFIIKRDALFELYNENRNIESFGRKMAELVAQHAIEMAMSLASDKPEERVIKLIQKRPDLFQAVPQRYLANLVGITPESLSRIRSRLIS